MVLSSCASGRVLWTVYEFAGLVLPDGCDVAASFLTRCRGSRISLPCRCSDFGFVSRAQASFLQLQTLRRHVSRPVAAGVSFSLKDVAAPQYVSSRGADNLSSHVSSFGSDFCSPCYQWFQWSLSTPIEGSAVQSETVFHCSEASQSTTKVTKHSAATAGQLP